MDLGHRQAAIRAARRGFLGGRRGIWLVPPTGPMTSTLNGSKALVTGATAGIGHAIALQLAREGGRGLSTAAIRSGAPKPSRISKTQVARPVSSLRT